jgi:hypothetical protein
VFLVALVGLLPAIAISGASGGENRPMCRFRTFVSRPWRAAHGWMVARFETFSRQPLVPGLRPLVLRDRQHFDRTPMIAPLTDTKSSGCHLARCAISPLIKSVLAPRIPSIRRKNEGLVNKVRLYQRAAMAVAARKAKPPRRRSPTRPRPRCAPINWSRRSSARATWNADDPRRFTFRNPFRPIAERRRHGQGPFDGRVVHHGPRAPRLAGTEYVAIRRALYGRDFQAGLRRAMRDTFRRHPDLTKVRVTVTR